jgi:hypothetical protein
MYQRCDVCEDAIQRDFVFTDDRTTSSTQWLGVCGCANRKWRWRSATGDPPWELIGKPTDPLPRPRPIL